MPRSMARLGCDPFAHLGGSLLTSGTIVADMPLADAVLDKWFKGAMMNYKRGYFR